MLIRIRFVAFTAVLFLSVAASAITITLPGSYQASPPDIIVLDSTRAERIVAYDISLLIGDKIDFGVRFANLNAMNALFGDSAVSGGFSIRCGANLLGQAENITSELFDEISVAVDSVSQSDSLILNLSLTGGSDPLALYRPWLTVTDSLNPAPIIDLAVSANYRHGVLLGWTATGDDSLSRNAALYDLRYSNIIIDNDTALWWEAAIRADNMPPPGSPGDHESLEVSGLDTNTTYYFLLVTYDELGNRSGFSNLALGTTLGPSPNMCLYYGGNNFAEVPFNTMLNTGIQLTLEAWFYLQGDFAGNHACILDKPAPDHSTPFYQYNMGPANHTDFYAQVAIDGRYNPFELYNVVQTDTWTHAAVTFDGVDRVVYLNGSEVSRVSDPGQLDSYNSDIRLGALKNLTSWFFKGYIDEIRIWDIARTETEIAQDMGHELGGIEAGLVAYWNFNEGSGQTFSDLTINRIDGYLGNSPDTDSFDPQWVESTAPIDTPSVDIGENPNSGVSSIFRIEQNYPNPFNSETRITFALPRAAGIRLEVFDMLGRKVKTLADGSLNAGKHDITWDGLSETGQQLSSGIYFYRLLADGFEQTQKMLMLK